ncbi:MAG: hypothetical protein LCH67_05100 [Bacteroidetes bacterium]|nr:hypothetical protein [Bacteroidota bacterium]
MFKKILSTAIIVFSLSLASFAQDINGKWNGKVMDQFEVSYTFKAEGEKLTGSTVGPEGNEIILKDGKIKGNDIEFVLNIMDQDIKMVGKLESDTLKLKFNMMGNDAELVLKKEVK